MRYWLIRHPMILGSMFIILSFFSFRDSHSDAQEYRQFVNAKTLTGEVVSVEKSSSFPPRWRTTVKWRDVSMGSGESDVVVGTKSGWSTPKFAVGEKAEILVNAADRSKAILREHLSNSRPMIIAGTSFAPNDFWFGVFFSVAALFTFAFGGAIGRQLEQAQK
jgi:hypothetical protein